MKTVQPRRNARLLLAASMSKCKISLCFYGCLLQAHHNLVFLLNSSNLLMASLESRFQDIFLQCH